MQVDKDALKLVVGLGLSVDCIKLVGSRMWTYEVWWRYWDQKKKSLNIYKSLLIINAFCLEKYQLQRFQALSYASLIKSSELVKIIWSNL